jgi:hypothetical protein
MSRKLVAKLVFATAVTAVCVLGDVRLALAYGPLHCPNTGGFQAIAGCRDWCLDQCRTRTCYGDCLDENCYCP